jgi:hypothetical protein
MKRVHSEFEAHRDALKNAWNEKDGHLHCYYTEVIIDEDNPKSWRYISYDHKTPGKPGDLVVTCQLVNFMKKDLDEEEFIAAVNMLAAHFDGAEFDKDAIPFRHYYRMVPLGEVGGGMAVSMGERGFEGLDGPAGGRGIQRTEGPDRKEDRKGRRTVPCEICGAPAPAKGKYCAQCNRFILHHEDKAIRVAAMKRAWNKERGGFVCFITGVLLELDDFHGPWYITFDHPTPGEKDRVEVEASWVNGMKTNLTESQFRAIIRELSRHFRTGAPFDVTVVDGGAWMRMARRKRR